MVLYVTLADDVCSELCKCILRDYKKLPKSAKHNIKDKNGSGITKIEFKVCLQSAGFAVSQPVSVSCPKGISPALLLEGFEVFPVSSYMLTLIKSHCFVSPDVLWSL